MFLHLRTCLPAVLLLASYRASAQDLTNIAWDPITDAERNLKQARVDKDAGVEALFWNVHVEDKINGEDLQRVLKHYIRLKVFDDKGREKVTTIDIEYSSGTGIENIAARTVKADGTIAELKRGSVFQRDLVRAGGKKVRVKSFALPGVEPGSIVEYRYTEYRDHPDVLYTRLQMQTDYPVERLTYFVKPLSREATPYHMAVWPFNCKPSALKEERDGYESFSLENVSAFRGEPLMFGEPNVREWVLLIYRNDGKRDPDKYWGEVGKKTYEALKQSLKAGDALKQAVAAALANASNDEEKAANLVRSVQEHTRGMWDNGVTDADRAKIKMPKDRRRTAEEILKSGLATSDEQNLLLAAMVTNAGLEARPTMLANRQDLLFDPRIADDYFLDNIDTAIKLGDTWKIYDPSARALPPGMLEWTEEGVAALLSDPKKATFMASQIAPPEASEIHRTAKFTLSEDGTLEGDVDETYTGHCAGDHRRDLQGESEARRQEILKQKVVDVYPQSEVSLIDARNVDQGWLPLAVHYHVKIPNYATRMSKRMLLQPLFFQRGSTPLFTAATRTYPIAFHFAWKETDAITIKLPDGFNLEQPEKPAQASFGKPGSYGYSVERSGDGAVQVTRDLIFGKEGALAFDPSTYSLVKSVFDMIYSRDTHSVALTQTGGLQ